MKIAALTLIAVAVIAMSLGGAGQGDRRGPRRSFASIGGASWTAPAVLADCSGPQTPTVLFPQETPFRRTGEGAIVFVGWPNCRLGPGVTLAAIGAADRPGKPHLPSTASGRLLAMRDLTAAAATTKGQIALVGPGSSPSHPSSQRLSEGSANGVFERPADWVGAEGPIAVTSAYLGDVALATCLPSEGAVQLRIQRHFQRAFAKPLTLAKAGPPGKPCGALTVALDYRTDAMAVWWHDGWLYARERHEGGRLGRLQRFAKASADAQVAAVISDDGRAILAWVDPGEQTGSLHPGKHAASLHPGEHAASLHLDISKPGMLLGPGRVVERLRWSGSRGPAEGWVRLVRLSTEGVSMAWTGTEAGHFAVRAASVTLRGLRRVRTLSEPSESAILQDLATGPHGDALTLWSAERLPARGRAMPYRRPAGARKLRAEPSAIMAYWTVPYRHRASLGGQPEPLSHAALAAARVAIDPSTGRAVAVWRQRDGTIRYALGRPPGA